MPARNRLQVGYQKFKQTVFDKCGYTSNMTQETYM